MTSLALVKGLLIAAAVKSENGHIRETPAGVLAHASATGRQENRDLCRDISLRH